MYAQRRLKKYSSLTGTTRIFRFDHTVTLGFCLLISGHDFPFFYSFNIYRMKIHYYQMNKAYMSSLRLIYIKRITYTVTGLSYIQVLMILNQKFFILASITTGLSSSPK